MSNTKTLTLSDEQAKEIYPDAPKSLRVILEDNFGGKKFFMGKITDRVKTIQDVFEELGEDYDEFIEANESDEPDEVAYKLLKKVAKVLNQGWAPNWNDSNQRKWYPWFRMGAGFGFSADDCAYDCTHSAVGSRLVFENSELATYAGRQFESLYKDLLNN